MCKNFLYTHCFENFESKLTIVIQFYFEICLDFEKVYFTKVLGIEKPYNFCVFLKIQFCL